MNPVILVNMKNMHHTLYNMNYSGGTQNDIQSAIIEMVRLNPKVTRKAIAKRLNMGTRTLQRVLNNMPSVEYVGTGSNGHWEVKE